MSRGQTFIGGVALVTEECCAKGCGITFAMTADLQRRRLGDHGWFDKRWMDEECLRMPLVMAWPGHVEGGKEIAQLTQNIDFAPTFLDLAGVAVPTAVQGRSLVPLLEDPAAKWRSSIYYHYYESQATHMVAAHYGIRTDRYKLIRYYEPQWDTWELFDLQQDPDEVRDLAGDPAHRELKQQLAAGKGDGEILAWVQANAKFKRTAAEIEAWSLWHERRAPNNPDGREYLNDEQKRIAPNREDFVTWFDYLDIDDHVSFGGKA